MVSFVRGDGREFRRRGRRAAGPLSREPSTDARVSFFFSIDQVRRAKLFYLRGLVGKQARLKTRFVAKREGKTRHEIKMDALRAECAAEDAARAEAEAAAAAEAKAAAEAEAAANAEGGEEESA